MPGQRRRSVSGFGMAMAICFGLAGCDLSEPYTGPAFPFLDGFGNAQDSAPVLLSNADWWAGLHDPVLDELVRQALSGNLDLTTAQDRVTAARAARNSIPGAGLLSPEASATLRGNEDGASASGMAEVGLEWVLDPYGTRRDRLRAAEGRVDIAEAEVDAARLLVLFNLANAYVSLRHDQWRLTLSQRELRSRRDEVALIRREVEAEEATRLDVTRAAARVADLQSQIPAQDAAIAAGLNEIAVLTGLQPGTLPDDMMAKLHRVTAQPNPHLTSDVGIPADLLRNRPDIRIAERRYYVAVAEIGPARAELYPRLSLSGAITLNLLNNSSPNTEYYFGPVVQFPALPTQAAQASIATRHAEARQAHSAWKATVLDAILEVENALVDYNAASLAVRSAEEARHLYGEALGLTRDLFSREEATAADVIAAELALNAAERNLGVLRHRHAQSFIALNIRLGAGHLADNRPPSNGHVQAAAQP